MFSNYTDLSFDRAFAIEDFDISFDNLGKPVCDDNFHKYVLELDDATKVLNSNSGEMVNFSDTPLDTFLEAREHVDNDEIEKILEM